MGKLKVAWSDDIKIFCRNVWALRKAVPCGRERSGPITGCSQSNRGRVGVGGGAEKSSGEVWNIGDQPQSFRRVREG